MIHLSDFFSCVRDASEAELIFDSTLGGRLRLASAGNISICYAPFDYIADKAKLVIVGITPGAQQARNSLLELRKKLLAGADHDTALEAAKTFASFSGPMRSNLIAMLDHIGVNHWLDVTTTAVVWETRKDLAHFTSALRYPVYVEGRNYSGSPSMTRTPVLRELLECCLAEEAKTLSHALWVPLGPAATEGVSWVVSSGLLDRDRVLAGLPHPSGANAERVAYFLGRKAREKLSTKTSPQAIDQARSRLQQQIAALSG